MSYNVFGGTLNLTQPTNQWSPITEDIVESPAQEINLNNPDTCYLIRAVSRTRAGVGSCSGTHSTYCVLHR